MFHAWALVRNPGLAWRTARMTTLLPCPRASYQNLSARPYCSIRPLEEGQGPPLIRPVMSGDIQNCAVARHDNPDPRQMQPSIYKDMMAGLAACRCGISPLGRCSNEKRDTAPRLAGRAHGEDKHCRVKATGADDRRCCLFSAAVDAVPAKRLWTIVEQQGWNLTLVH